MAGPSPFEWASDSFRDWDQVTPSSSSLHSLMSTAMFITLYIIMSIPPPQKIEQMAQPSRRPLSVRRRWVRATPTPRPVAPA